jgi:hypothetical protein
MKGMNRAEEKRSSLFWTVEGKLKHLKEIALQFCSSASTVPKEEGGFLQFFSSSSFFM